MKQTIKQADTNIPDGITPEMIRNAAQDFTENQRT
jgi:hypothetical protein